MPNENYISYFFENTSLHGFQCLIQKNRLLIERLFWVLVFIIVYFTCGFVIVYLSYMWLDSPTVRFIENNEYPIQDIPFPSITICSKDQLRKSNWDLNINNTLYLAKLQQYYNNICFFHRYGEHINNDLIEYFDQETIKMFANNCPISCSELFKTNTTWKDISLPNFCRYVQLIPTILGVCYVFNMIPAYEMFNEDYYELYKDFFLKTMTYDNTKISKWNIDDGYSNTVQEKMLLDVVPARINGVGYNNRFSMMLYLSSNKFKSCSTIFQGGFLIDFNNPAELPWSFTTKSLIQVNSHVHIQVTPYVEHISSDLRSRSPDVRKCYLNNERKLKIFRKYTWINCRKECYINNTLAKCGCVGLDAIPMPKNVKICGLAKKNCIISSMKQSIMNDLEKRCKCWPSCSDIRYMITESSSYDDWSYLKKTNLERNDSTGAMVDIVFKSPRFMAYKAKTIFSVNQYISIIGGCLGLYLGFNIYSLFEIVYVVIIIAKHYFVKYFTK